MSQLRANTIVNVNNDGSPTFPFGITGITSSTNAGYAEVAGIATVAQNLTGSPDITVTGLTVEDSSAPNVEFKVTSTQATNTNKALTINNNDQTEGLDISYKGEILPKSNGEVNLGGPSNRWGNIYIDDINASGNVTIAGTITYQDVSEVNAVGVATFRDNVYFGFPGAGVTITPSGNISAASSITAAIFYGDGSQLQGVQAGGSGSISFGAATVDITSCLFT